MIDNVALRRYEMDLGGEKAVVEYIVGPGYRILTHTEVPPRFEGQGIGGELVLAVLEDMRAKSLQVIPQCSFIARYIDHHPEWERILVRRSHTGRSAPTSPRHRSPHPARRSPDRRGVFSQQDITLLLTGLSTATKKSDNCISSYRIFAIQSPGSVSCQGDILPVGGCLRLIELINLGTVTFHRNGITGP